jgi:putative ABC transport system substrate-binding protein
MQRREFITLFGGAVAAWPLVARAQQPALPVVGYLDSKVAAPSFYQVAAVRQGLNEAGLVEGRNVAIEFRWAEGQLDRLPALAADLVRRRVAAIVTDTPTMPTARAATSTIPIVFVSGADPVEAGLLGRQILIVKAGKESEIDAAFATIVQAGAGALFVGGSGFYVSRRRQLAALAARHALPASYYAREFVVAGGLMSYGASDTDAYRRAGLYVGRILKGAKPADLPVELPTRYELVFNLATAKALKIDIPPKLLALADEVIE